MCAAQPTGYDQHGTCVRMLTMAERKQRRRAFLARQKEEEEAAAAAAAAAAGGGGEGSVHSATSAPSATSAHSAPESSEVPRSEVVAAQHVKESIEILRRRVPITRRDLAEIAHQLRAQNEAYVRIMFGLGRHTLVRDRAETETATRPPRRNDRRPESEDIRRGAEQPDTRESSGSPGAARCEQMARRSISDPNLRLV